MAMVYVGLGGNIGDRAQYLSQARDALFLRHEKTACSSLYETAPWGDVDQGPFLNAVVGLITKKTPEELLLDLLAIEQHLGRIRTRKNGPRSIDLDILLYDLQIIFEPGLVIPHPHLQERTFVLVPLAEIAPQARHPVFQKTVGELKAERGVPSGEISLYQEAGKW